ncbi:MAG: hypothetical protein II819_08930 [Fibrobacter sp.]|nr:hypothetical protein [Fibrobacter sp.]
MSEKYLFGFSEWGNGKYDKRNTVYGCSHKCKYCGVAARASSVHRRSSAQWSVEEVNGAALSAEIQKKDELFIYPTSHDITPEHLDIHLQQIRKILDAGNQLLICSKMHYDCVVAICNANSDKKSQINMRCTIGSKDSSILRWWEPGAPDYDERKSAVKYAYSHGFPCSLSCEPMLDCNIEAVVEDMRSIVTESIWIGKMNNVRQNLTLNGVTGPVAEAKASVLLAWQNDDSNIMRLVKKYADDPLIRWKESIKRVIDRNNNEK